MILTLLTVAALASPALAYTVYLKDGSRLIAAEQPVIEDGQAIITLQSGTRTSIAASEIDLERTREANKEDYGTALVLEEGSFTELNEQDLDPRRDRLSDVAAGSSLGSRPRARRPTSLSASEELGNWQRVPYRANLDLATEILAVFRGQGIEQVAIYQGTANRRLLIELPANSESAVFRGLKITAGALTRARGLYPEEVDAFELVMTTAQGGRAGQFLITADEAAELLAEGTELSSFFVANVRF